MNTSKRGREIYDDFALNTSDIYPDKYTLSVCEEIAEQLPEAEALAQEKGVTPTAHYYTPPESQMAAHKVGDSLALSLYARDIHAKKVISQTVAFMGTTAKIITGDATKVYLLDHSSVLGCSLVNGTDHVWIQNWKRLNPKGILLTYINSDVFLKSMSDFITTSRNTDEIAAYAIKQYPGQPILIAPDKYLGVIMKIRALKILEEKYDIKASEEIQNLIQIYDHSFQGNNASCYIHEKFDQDRVDTLMDMYPDAILMMHPECGCIVDCRLRLEQGKIAHEQAYIASTEKMIHIARASSASTCIVATEAGHLWALRKLVPEKTFIPVSPNAHCEFMKGNNLTKLIRSLRENRWEIIFCDDCQDCIDPRFPYEDDKFIHIPRHLAEKAKQPIDRMFAFQ